MSCYNIDVVVVLMLLLLLVIVLLIVLLLLVSFKKRCHAQQTCPTVVKRAVTWQIYWHDPSVAASAPDSLMAVCHVEKIEKIPVPLPI